jgi:hypothetical protein
MQTLITLLDSTVEWATIEKYSFFLELSHTAKARGTCENMI